jgi:hypothetical protein
MSPRTRKILYWVGVIVSLLSMVFMFGLGASTQHPSFAFFLTGMILTIPGALLITMNT